MTIRTICFLIPALALNVNLFAQQSETEQWLSDSFRAIQFGIGSYHSVQSFDNKSISYKVHLTATRALRFGASLSGSTDKNESHITTFSDDSLTSSTDRSIDPAHSYAIELLALHVWYIDTRSDVFLFAGVGPLVEFSRREYSGSSSSSLNTSWSVGVGGTIGTEWFVHHRISLHAEYQASGQYTHERSSTTNVNNYSGGVEREVREYRYKTWSITSHKVLFGFSVYF